MNATAPRILERARGKGLEITPQTLSHTFLEMANVRAEYIQEKERSSEGLAEMRARLNSEPGVAIANHPGAPDALIMVSLISRKDLKIVTSKGAEEILEKVLGKGICVGMKEGSKELIEQMEELEAHVRSGGLVLVFPTGGDTDATQEENSVRRFRGGFRRLIESMRPTDMVYSFWIDPEEVQKARRRFPGMELRVVSEALFPLPERVVKNPDKHTIHVDEKYSQAKEWQTITGETPAKKDAHLREYFLRQFLKS